MKRINGLVFVVVGGVPFPTKDRYGAMDFRLHILFQFFWWFCRSDLWSIVYIVFQKAVLNPELEAIHDTWTRNHDEKQFYFGISPQWLKQPIRKCFQLLVDAEQHRCNHNFNSQNHTYPTNQLDCPSFDLNGIAIISRRFHRCPSKAIRQRRQ